MLKLLNTELKVWSKYSQVRWISFWAMSSIIIGPLFLVQLIKKHININEGLTEITFSFPTVFNSIAIIELLPIQFVSIILITVVCSDYESDTYKMYLLNGQTPTDLWLSKLYLNITSSVLVSAISFLVAIGYGLLFSVTSFEIAFESISYYLILLFQSFNFFTFAVFVALIFRKTGTSFVFYILWFSILERTVAQIVNYNAPFYAFPLGSMLPGKSTEDLTIFTALTDHYIKRVGFETERTMAAVFWPIFLQLISWRLFWINRDRT